MRSPSHHNDPAPITYGPFASEPTSVISMTVVISELVGVTWPRYFHTIGASCSIGSNRTASTW